MPQLHAADCIVIAGLFTLFLSCLLGAACTITHGSSGLGIQTSGQRIYQDDLEVISSPVTLPAAQPATLTTRTDNTHGTLTMGNSGHGIVTGQRLDLYWPGGQTFNVTAGTVAGTSVPFTCNATLAPPAAPTTGTASAGALAATTYYVKVTYVNALGETVASAESTQAALINTVLTVTSPTPSGAGLLAAVGYNVYVGNTASGGSGSETKQNNAPVAIGVTWTEPTTGLLTTGAAPPTTPTAGANLPAATTAITVGLPQSKSFTITPANLTCLVCSGGAVPPAGVNASYFVFNDGTNDVLPICLAQGEVYNWPSGGGVAPNPFGYQSVSKVWLSHAQTSGAVTNQQAAALTH